MEKLNRALRRRDVVAITVNTIVGAGIFGLPSALAASAGPAALAVLGAAFALIAGVALCAAEVSSRFDATGGPVRYAHEALGPLGGFTVGWLIYLTRLATSAAITVVMLDYAASLWPLLADPLARAVAIVLFIGLVAGLNLRGITGGAGIANLLIVAKMLPLVALAIAALVLAGLPAPSNAPVPPLDSLSGAFLLAFFACMGFEQATVIAGELRDPRRDLPIGMLSGFALTGVLYAALLLGCQATVPELAASKQPLADAGRALFGTVGAILVAAAAVLSCAGNLSTSIMVSPRVLYALAEQGELPGVFARVTPRTQVPAIAIMLTALLMALLALSKTFAWLAALAAIARMLMYASICLALPLLRHRGRARFHLPGGSAIAVVSILACAAVLVTSKVQALYWVAAVLAAGYLLRFAWRRSGARTAPAAEETSR